METLFIRTESKSKFYPSKKFEKENLLASFAKNKNNKSNKESFNRISRRILGIDESSLNRKDFLNLSLDKVNNFTIIRNNQKRISPEKETYFSKNNSLNLLRKELSKRFDFSILKVILNLTGNNGFYELRDLLTFVDIESSNYLNRFLNFNEIANILNPQKKDCIKTINGKFDHNCLDTFFTLETKRLMKSILILYFS